MKQTTPVAALISDSIVSVSTISFTDLGLDASQYDGNDLSWTAAFDTSLTGNHTVYVATDVVGTTLRKSALHWLRVRP